MKTPIWSRRKVLQATSALAAGTALPSTRVLSAAPPASAVTPQLIEAAKKEGKVVWYTSVDLPLAEKVGKSFEAKYGHDSAVERTGPSACFHGIAQEYGSNIRAVDVVNSSDAAHFIVWKRQTCSRLYLPRMSPNSIRRAQGSGRHLRQLPRLGLIIATKLIW